MNQLKFVIEKLEDHGYVSRNECLANYISRLGSIMNRLKNNGWKYLAGYEKTKKGKDYIYTLISKPKK